ncbi:hypothetical protein J0871_16920 [Salegentibacter sp. BDJ18]|uniref:hypothetical protein n=1 Tax=Salegentibacter sp. BDJ18 TaxID=2816376 RepID=UPI001AAFA06E|nr:hypothetical protein [Salegentibacter sp. BDJ18]MBO2546101.1 hypothetical protein [Salegentibacter sp. BDJ18]
MNELIEIVKEEPVIVSLLVLHFFYMGYVFYMLLFRMGKKNGLPTMKNPPPPPEKIKPEISRKEIEEAFKYLRTRGMRKKSITNRIDKMSCFPLYVPTCDIDPVLEMLLTGKWQDFQKQLELLKYYDDEGEYFEKAGEK